MNQEELDKRWDDLIKYADDSVRMSNFFIWFFPILAFIILVILIILPIFLT